MGKTSGRGPILGGSAFRWLTKRILSLTDKVHNSGSGLPGIEDLLAARLSQILPRPQRPWPRTSSRQLCLAPSYSGTTVGEDAGPRHGRAYLLIYLLLRSQGACGRRRGPAKLTLSQPASVAPRHSSVVLACFSGHAQARRVVPGRPRGRMSGASRALGRVEGERLPLILRRIQSSSRLGKPRRLHRPC